MADIDFCELSIEQEEYLVELLCTRGACTLDYFARELDELCRENAGPYPPRQPLTAECADASSVEVPVIVR